MQGNPDPYSAFSQGLTGGMNTGMNIMQMMQQKAQAAQAAADKKITTSLEILKDENIPDDVKDGFYATFKAGVEQQYPKIILPDKYTMDSKVAKQYIALGETYKDNPNLLHKARQSLLEGSSNSIKDLARFDQSMKEGKEKADTYNRGLAWADTPLTAPNPWSATPLPDSPNTMYGLTGNVPGAVTKGLGTKGQEAGLNPFQLGKAKADYLATGKFDVPTGASGVGGEDMFLPVPTSSGYRSFKRGTGEYLIPKGENLMPPVADVNLTSEKERVKKEAQFYSDRRAVFPKMKASLMSLENQWGSVEKTIDKAIKEVSPYTAGVGAWGAAIPASPAKNLQQTLETIRANVGFDKLQDMRQNSPTGGALGQVSDFENKLLQSVQGSLDQKQSPAQLIENLNNIKFLLKLTREQKKQAFQQDYFDFIDKNENNNKAPAASLDADYNALPSGATYTAPDGTQRRKR